MRADRLARAGAVLAALAFSLGLGCGLRVYLHVDPRQLAPRIWAYLGAGGNSLVVVHGVEALAVDLKDGDSGLRQRRLVEQDLGRKVRRIVLTHSHLDHWGGLVLYPDVGAVLAHPRTRERISAWLRAHREPDLYPWISVRTELRLMLGEEQEEVWIRYLGPGHTDGDLVAFLPGHGLVMTGDLFCKGFEPTADASSGGSLLGLRRTLDALLGYEFQDVLPGHGTMATRADVVAVRDYLTAMEVAAREAASQGLSEDAAVEAGEAALRAFPRLDPVPLLAGRRDNLLAMYREVLQADKAGKSAAP